MSHKELEIEMEFAPSNPTEQDVLTELDTLTEGLTTHEDYGINKEVMEEIQKAVFEILNKGFISGLDRVSEDCKLVKEEIEGGEQDRKQVMSRVKVALEKSLADIDWATALGVQIYKRGSGDLDEITVPGGKLN
jgi:hypothetical protein